MKNQRKFVSTSLWNQCSAIWNQLMFVKITRALVVGWSFIKRTWKFKGLFFFVLCVVLRWRYVWILQQLPDKWGTITAFATTETCFKTQLYMDKFTSEWLNIVAFLFWCFSLFFISADKKWNGLSSGCGLDDSRNIRGLIILK